MSIKTKLNLVKKNFYFAIIVVVLLFVVGFAIAAYDTSKASHGTLYTDRIETKSQTDDTIEVIAKLDVLGLLINGTPIGVLGGSGLQDIKSIITSYDTNKNDVIDQFELLNAIDDWTNLKISRRVLGIIHELWAGQFPISGLPNSIGVVDYNLFNAFTTDLYSAYFKGGRGVKIDGNLTVNGNIQASGTICDSNGCIGSGVNSTGGGGAKIYSAIGRTDISVDDTKNWATMAGTIVQIPADFKGGDIYVNFNAAIRKKGYTWVRLVLDLGTANEEVLIETPQIDLMNGLDYGTYGQQGGSPVSLSYVKEGLSGGSHSITAQWKGKLNQDGVLSPRVMTVIAGGGGGGSGGGPISWNGIQNIPAGFADGVDDVGGGEASLPTCSDGQILKYNSATGKWECADAGGVGGGVSFGEWIDVTAAASGGATQTAASDGFVFIMSGSPAMSAFTDSTDPPQTRRARTKSSGMGDSHSATMAVRQGDNWRVTGGGTIYWIPLVGGGSGGGGS